MQKRSSAARTRAKTREAKSRHLNPEQKNMRGLLVMYHFPSTIFYPSMMDRGHFTNKGAHAFLIHAQL